MGELLATVADRLEAEQEWLEIEAAYARLKREDPTGWQEYLRELTEWEADSEPDTTATSEWPEYNR
jgi:hypothetical protein